MTTLCRRCSRPENKQTHPFLQCEQCSQFVHLECLSSRTTPGNLHGDVFFEFTCASCSSTGVEVLEREKVSWLYVVSTVLNHLSKKCAAISNNGYFHWKTHLASFIINHWDVFFDPSFKRKKKFSGTFSGLLSNWSGLFFTSGLQALGENGWWKLADGFSPALVKYLYTEFTAWKQLDRKNPSLIANDKMMEYKIIKGILAQIGFDHIIAAPGESKDQRKLVKNEPLSENESYPNSPKSEARSPKSEISSTSYKTEPMASEVDDYFTNYLMDGDDSLMISNFDDMLMGFDDPKESFSHTIKFDSSTANNSDIERLLRLPDPDSKLLNKCDASSNENKVERVKQKSAEYEPPPPVKSLFSDSTKSTSMPWKSDDNSESFAETKSHFISKYTELDVLNRLNSVCRRAHFVNVDRKVVRLRAKLALRRLKRSKHLPAFNLDNLVCKYAHYPTQETSSNTRILDQFQHTSLTEVSQLNLYFRLVASYDVAPFISPYSGKLLKPYIWRDSDVCPLWVQVMDELEFKVNKKTNPNWVKRPRASLDYCYVRPQHISSINNLCSQYFWPGIDISDTLLYPEFSCVVLYKKIIVGFAFLVPDVNYNEAYLSFIFTRPEWRKCGIASFMLYHLTQTCVDRDIILHVSASNSAIFMYQKFGFKIEEFLQEFYDKYFPPESKECKHAFFLRLSRS